MKKRFPLGCKAALLLGCWGLLVAGGHAAKAATFSVTSTLDAGVGSLRQAILSANSTAGDDTIAFELPGVGPYVVNLTTALPALNSNISIVYDTARGFDVTVRRSTVSGTAPFRIFAVSPGAIVSISGLTIANGSAFNGTGSALGGGMRNDGTLKVTNCIVEGNDATGANATVSQGFDGQGGAIYNSGALTVTNCIFTGNIARGGSGVGSGSGGAGQGGALYSNAGTVTLTGCAFANNAATGGNGATGGVGQGGAIRSKGELSLLNCALNANSAGSNIGDAQGGGLYNSGTASLVGCSLSGNTASSTTGGVAQGGGVRSDGPLSIVNSTLLGNEARGGNSADSAGPGVGGGLYNGGSATVKGSTFENNLAQGGSNSGQVAGGAGLGGGIFNGNTAATNLILNNSTLSQNRAVAGAGGITTTASLGGGLYMQGGGSGVATITGSTITLNQAADGTGILVSGGDLTLRNTIVANNSPANAAPAADVRGAVNAASQYNLIGDGSALTGISNGTNGNQIGGDSAPIIDPKLGPLQDNGGPTKTHALLSGSPALDKGKSFGLTTDQRGVSRPYDDAAIANATGGDGSDIGAFEVRPAALPLLSVNDIAVTEGSGANSTATFTVTLSAPATQNVTVTIQTANGLATAPADYTATTATLTFTPGQTTKTFSVPVVGDAVDEANEAFYVLLSSPTNASLGKGRGVATISDDDASPTVSIADAVVQEGNTGQRVAVFRLDLSAPSGRVVTVNYYTQNGTATAPSDYAQIGTAAAPSSVSFSVGNTLAYIRVFINGDTLDESDETFSVNLLSVTGATLADTVAQGTVLNDDTAPALTISDASVTEGNSGTKNLTFTVSLSKASGQTVSVNYATANGSARSASDYVAQTGTLSFAPGSPLTRTLSIVITGDTIAEGDETLYVLLTNAVNASVGRARGTGTIVNDDASG